MRIEDVLYSYHDNTQLLRSSLENLKKSHLEVLKFYSRIPLYSSDKDLLKNISSIYNDAILKHNTALRLLITLEDVSIKHKKLKSTVESIQDDEEFTDFKNEYAELVKERDEAIEQYQNKSEELKNKLIDAKKHLRKVFSKKILQGYS